jgi:Zn-dependent protease with chaperone function
MAYWRKVFAQAWADTKQSFGWNQKTAATVLGALAIVAVAFFHFGFAAMLTSAIGLFWTALPIVSAGFLLFVWNFFSVPAALHTELNKKIAALESTLAKLEEPPPDYAAVRHIDRLTLREAAFYWCDLSPGRSMPSNVRDWYSALESAVTKGELNFEPKYSGYMSRETERDVQRRNPQLDTKVTRKPLQAFAQRHGHDPKFLRDA